MFHERNARLANHEGDSIRQQLFETELHRLRLLCQHLFKFDVIEISFKKVKSCIYKNLS